MQATLTAGQSGIGYKRARDSYRLQYTSEPSQPKQSRFQAMIQDAVLAGLLGETTLCKLTLAAVHVKQPPPSNLEALDATGPGGR